MLTIRLLGPPAIERDGRPVRSPRGRKAWALLALVLLADRPPSRQRLAELLFGDANDPLATLRWTLSELRRALGAEIELGGDPVIASFDHDAVTVDICLLVRPGLGQPGIDQPAPLLELGGELLEGVTLDACPEFEMWLAGERHRASAALEALLHQAAVSLLAQGRAEQAVPYAERAVARNPLEEGNHELLARSLATAGDRAGALRQIAVCEDLMRRHFGVEPSAALREAATAGAGSPQVPALSGRAAAASQLEAGNAAIVAGAVDAGIQCLRRAAAEAARCGDTALQASALVALGGALVHAARGRDEEGSVVLHEAIALAEQAGDRASAVTAYRELGFVDVQAGRRVTADRWLAKAQDLATDDEQLGAILGVRGMSASDRGDYPAAFAYLTDSVERAAGCGDHRQEAWSLSIAARAHLLRGEDSQAAAAVTRSLELVRAQRWIAFLPWPIALQAELRLRAGDLAGSGDAFEQAWVLGCQLGDACWEGMAARGLGRLSALRGDHAGATSWLTEAVTRSVRVPDRYQWVHGYVLDACVGAALECGDQHDASRLAASLASLSARCDMRELLARAHLHLSRLGDPTALDSARALAADIDNPALAELVGAAGTARAR